MLFFLGIITGITISTLIVVVLLYMRRPVERTVERLQRRIESAGPRPKGYIVEPDDEAEEARQEIIARNKRLGRATKIEELL